MNKCQIKSKDIVNKKLKKIRKLLEVNLKENFNYLYNIKKYRQIL